jgi:DHA1 family bicyclomycin/chloramphenicol resistance-like MFS transporter
MQAEFHLTAFGIQQTLTAYLVPYALASLLHGPLSDALGRRRIVLWGTGLYAFASIACAFTPNFPMLLAFRALQGVSGGAGLTVGRAVIRDLNDGPAAQRLMGTVSMLFFIAPAVAPVTGGWLFVAFGWRSVFVFLALLGLVVFVAVLLRLPETHPVERRTPFVAGLLFGQAWRVAVHRRFLTLVLCSGVTFGAILAYIASAPAIILDRWGLSETQFAWLFLPIISGFMVGAYASNRLAGRVTHDFQVTLGQGCSIAGASCAVLLHATVLHPPILLQQLLMAVTALGIQLVTPVLMLRALDLHPEARGSAASVLTFVALLLNSLVFGLVGPLVHGSMLGLAGFSLGSAVLGFALWRSLPGRLRMAPAPGPTPGAS